MGSDCGGPRPLRAEQSARGTAIRAHCGDCHADDGRDLKYFNYSNLSIVARSQFHGLSQREGILIASYIRPLSCRIPGVPGILRTSLARGCRRRPGAELAAGAGLDWVLDEDSETLRSLFGSKLRHSGSGGGVCTGRRFEVARHSNRPANARLEPLAPAGASAGCVGGQVRAERA